MQQRGRVGLAKHEPVFLEPQPPELIELLGGDPALCLGNEQRIAPIEVGAHPPGGNHPELVIVQLLQRGQIDLVLRWNIVPGRRAAEAQRVEHDLFDRLSRGRGRPFEAKVELVGEGEGQG